MFSAILLVVLVALTTTALPLEELAAKSPLKTSLKIPSAFRAASPDVAAGHYLELRAGTGSSRSSKLLKTLSISASGKPISSGDDVLSNNMNTEYLVDIAWQDTTFTVSVDTGSSDTWLVRKGFECVSDYSTPLPQSACAFGPTFNGSFQGGKIANQNFLVGYADGDFLTGVMGHSHVTLAGITVVHQEVALVDEADWTGDNVTSGLLGLAYRSLTSAYNGTDPALDTLEGAIHYSPIFESMYTQGLTAPLFSLALQRSSDTNKLAPGGYMSFGGYPPVKFRKTFTSTPILLMQVSATVSEYTFYAINVEAIVSSRAGKQSSSRSLTARQETNTTEPVAEVTTAEDVTFIVDSGTTLVYAPNDVVLKLAKQFRPPARYVNAYGLFFARCNATVPNFGVTINGTTFYVNEKDLLLQSLSYATPNGVSHCALGVQEGNAGPYVLGDVFLQSVVAVFDVGAAEMRFAAHLDY